MGRPYLKRAGGALLFLLVVASCGSSKPNQASGGAGEAGSANVGEAGTGGTSAAGSGGVAGSAEAPEAGAAGAGTPGVTSLDDFHSAFIAAACENLFECSYGSDALTLRVLVQTRANCQAFFEAQFGPALEARAQAAQRGTVDFVLAEAERCVSSLAHSCDFWEGEEPLDAFAFACEGVFEGHVPSGGNCASDEDCAGSAHCMADTLGQPTCLGTCVARVAPGEPCDSERGCSAAGGDAAGCVDDVCVLFRRGAIAAQGEPCGVVMTDGAERPYVPCDSGLYCLRNGAVVGTCEPALAVDAACATEHEPCVGDAVCVDEADATVCRELTLQGVESAACNSAELALCDAFADLSCDDSATCAPLGAGACSPSWGALGCAPGQYCDEAAQCAEPLPAGQECQVGSQCQSGLCRQRLSGEPHRCYEPFCSEW